MATSFLDAINRAASDVARGRMPKQRQSTPGERLGQVGAELYRRGTQVVSGLLESTIANSATEQDIQEQRAQRERQYLPWLPDPVQAIVELTTGREGYRPAVMEQPGALYGIIQALTQDNPDPNSYGQRSLERVGVAQQRTRDALGTTQPQDALDMFLTGAGAMVVPGTAPMRITAASLPGRVAQGAGIAAAELALPLRNTRLALAAPISGTIAAGIGEGIEAFGGEIPDYTSISDLARTDNREYQANVQPDDIDAQLLADPQAPQMDEIDQMLTSGPAVASSGDDIDAMLTAMPTQLDQPDESNTLLTATAVIGSLLGGAAAARYVRGRIRASQESLATRAATGSAPEPEGRAPITGTRVRRSKYGGAREQLASRVAPVTDWFRDVVSPEEAERVGWRADRLTNTSLGPRVSHIQNTGRYEGHSQRYTPTAPLAEAITKDLTPQEQQQLYDAVLAARAVDDLENNGVQSAFTNDYTPAQLRQLVESVTSNPRLFNYYQNIQKVGREQLQFAVRENLLSPQEAREWVTTRPNWTKFNRALQEDRDFSELLSTAYTANRDSLGGAASKVEGGSLQAGASENPLQALIANWANLVRMAEVNKWRRGVLEAMDGVGDEGQAVVRRTRYKPGSTRDPNVHVVFRENGKREAYRVLDPAISLALHIKPRAQAMTQFEAMRTFFQQMTTGPIGSLMSTGFSVAASPVFDAMSAITTRKPGQVLGPLNNLILAATRGKAHLGVLDPTQPLTSYYGAARYVVDELANITARAFERRLLQNNSMLRDMLGEDGMRAWADGLRRYYNASVKGFGDEQGVFSTTLYGSPDPGKPLVHQEHLAPSFTRAQIGKYYRDTADAGAGPIARAIQAGKSSWFAVRATPVARTIALINEAMHNGQRYVTLANSRYQRGYQENLDKIVSETRRLGGDQSQHGSSTLMNQSEGVFPYAAQSVQAMYEMGRTIRRYPVAAMANYGVALPAMLATSYLALVYDDEARERHYSRTPQQQARILPMPGGMDLPITPELRPMLFGLRALFDQLTGIEDGNGELNWDLIGAFENLVDGETTPDDEEFSQELRSGLTSSASEAFPFNPLQIPLVQGAAGALGIEPMALRFGSGEIRDAYTQRISGLEADKSQLGALTSASWEAFIAGTTGAAGAAMVDIANEFAAVSGDRGMSEGLDAAGRRWQDIQQRRIQNSPLRPLFGQYESLRAVSDANWQLYQQRRQGIEDAARVISRDVIGQGATGMSAPLEMPAEAPQTQVQGTAAHTIGLAAQALQSDIRPLQQRMAALSIQAEGVRNAYTMRPEEQNRRVNELNRERQALSLQMLMQIRDREDYIGEIIGDPDFTFDGYRPDDYLVPIQPPQ